MFMTFHFDPVGIPGLACLLERDALPDVGSTADRFLTAASGVRAYPGASFGTAMRDLLDDPSVERVLVSRNPALVLDDSLADRLMAATARLDALDQPFALASGGGLGLKDERYCVLYSSVEPFLFFNRTCQPIVDTMVDLYLVDAAVARDLLDGNAHLDASFELAVILHGYLAYERVSLFIPDLASGINGPFRGRDLVRMAHELGATPLAARCGASLRTLSGLLMLPPAAETADRLGRPTPAFAPLLEKAIVRTVRAALDPLALSIVTRTQFRRPHLLRRMLTTVSRARVDGDMIEVVLSTDLPRDFAVPQADALRAAFPNIRITLAINDRPEHSRVANLIGGVENASGDYVWMIDDDDYIDLGSIDAIRSCQFAGARPIIFGASQVHHETWNVTKAGEAVLAATTNADCYPGSGWRGMFGGVNQLPICAAVAPRAFLLERIASFHMRFDLSEDYALFLQILSAPNLPPIRELDDVIAHISIRHGEDNSVTAPDRTLWTRDIAAYLHDLVHAGDPMAGGVWSIMALPRKAFEDRAAHAQIERLQKAVRDRETEIAGLFREVTRLQRLAATQLSAGVTAGMIQRELAATSRPAATLLAKFPIIDIDKEGSIDGDMPLIEKAA